MAQEELRIKEFLLKGVPLAGAKGLTEWEVQCRSLGPSAPEAFFDALRNGNETEQYAALLGLRVFGYEAYGEGFGKSRTYKVRLKDSSDWLVIVPLNPPRDEDADFT